jgi:hypothetical protein
VVASVEDLPRYAKDGYTLVSKEITAKLDVLIQEGFST